MNKVILLGRLTRDPEVRFSQGENSLAIARYTLAVDRRFKKAGELLRDIKVCGFDNVFTGHSENKYCKRNIKVCGLYFAN